MTTTTTPVNIAFLGLGTMGYPMAGHLANAGFNVTVYNRSLAKAEAWLNDYSGSSAATPAEAADGADIVCLCVGNDDDVRSVLYGDSGAIGQLARNAIVIDHTTTSAELAVELAAACKKVGAHFIDAPVSGGQAGAENGKLTAMCGGETETYETALPILQTYCANSQLMGEVGQGQRAKMVNQICIAGVLTGLSEGLALAQANGLPIDKLIAALQGGAAGSWQLSNRLATMADGQFEFGFALDWMIKDLSICLKEAEKHQLALPLTEKVKTQYEALSEQGKGRFDTSALCLAK